MSRRWPSKDPADYRGGAWLATPPGSPDTSAADSDGGWRGARRAPRWIAWLVVAPEHQTPFALLYGAWFVGFLPGLGLELLLSMGIALPSLVFSLSLTAATDRWWQRTRAPQGPRPQPGTTALATHPSNDPADYRGRGLSSGAPLALILLVGPLVFSQLLLAGYYASGESVTYLVIAFGAILPSLPVALAFRRRRERQPAEARGSR